MYVMYFGERSQLNKPSVEWAPGDHAGGVQGERQTIEARPQHSDRQLPFKNFPHKLLLS